MDEKRTAKGRRAPGRPRRADAPVVPWNEVDRLLVFGEKVKDEETGLEGISFPSYAELSTRYGVSKSRIGQYATRARCLPRRGEASERERARYEQKIVERRAEARALGADDVIQIIDGYIDGFRKSVEEGRVRCDSPADLDRLVRLKELMLGNADSRQELQGGLTLDAIQQRHQQWRTQVDELTPELAGIATTTSEIVVVDEVQGDGGQVH
jgi:hypothetical protein